MRSIVRAAYNRLGRPAPARLAAAAGALAATGLVVLAFTGAPRLLFAVAMVMHLLVLAGLAAVWDECRNAREQARASQDRAKVTFRRILAAIEVERLANERRHSSGMVPAQDQDRR